MARALAGTVVVVAVVAVMGGCGGGGGHVTPVKPKPRPVGGGGGDGGGGGPVVAWSVAFERSIGTLASAPVFTADGGIVSSGQRFDRDGRFVGLLAIEVGGGRTISTLEALIGADGGQAIAKDYNAGLIFGRGDQPPEQATAKAQGEPQAIAVAPDEKTVAVHYGDTISVLALPTLEPVQQIELSGETIGPVAIAYLADGGLAYATPCAGTGCSGSGLEVRTAAGKATRLRDAGIDALALSRDAAAIASGRSVAVVALPDGAAKGTITLPGDLDSGTTPGGALAIAAGGDTVAAVMCTQVAMWGYDGAAWRSAYGGTITRGGGEGGCGYPSGVVFAPDGKTLAIATRELTVLRPGPAPAPIEVDYAPTPPAGFDRAEDVTGVYMAPPGTGLASEPRVLGGWTGSGEVRAVVRDADEMAGFTDLDAWGTAVLTRFEPTIRDEKHPNQIMKSKAVKSTMPYKRAFLDASGRRNLEYTIIVRGGCEEMDRHIRWIEDGKALVEIDIESLGVPVKQMKAWLAAWFDAPLSVAAPKDRRIAAYKYFTGPC